MCVSRLTDYTASAIYAIPSAPNPTAAKIAILTISNLLVLPLLLGAYLREDGGLLVQASADR